MSLLYICNAWASDNDAYRQLTLDGIEYAYNMQIDRATEIFDELIDSDPENPHGYVLQSVNYFYRLQFDEQGLDFEKQFRKHTSEAIKLARRLLSSAERRTDAIFR